MQIRVPDYFLTTGEPKTAALDDFTFVQYKVTKNYMHLKYHIKANQLSIVLQGKKIIIADGEEFVIEPDTLAFAVKGKYIMSHMLDTGTSGYQSLLFTFSDQFIAHFIRQHHKLIYSSGTKTDVIKTIFTFKMNLFLAASIESLFPYFEFKSDYSSRMIEQKFNEIFLNVLTYDKSNHFKNYLRSIADQENLSLSGYMERHFCESLTISDFARNTGRSLTKFKQDFKKLFGASPGKWILTKRLERACRLLQNTTESVTDIGYLVGLNNSSHFISQFKKKYGITPGQFQKMSGNGKK